MAGERISVVVISRNEGAYLRRTVQNLDDTLPGTAEIIVVDDGSKDGSAESLAPRRGRLSVIRSHGAGVAPSRRLGAQRARGGVIVFADAHLGLDSGWWQPLADVLENPKVGAVAPAITQLPDRGMRGYGITFRGPAMEVRWCRRKPKAPAPVAVLPGCCVAMRREVVESTDGAWDAGLLQRGNIDNEFSVRLWLLGYELMVVPEVLVRHRFRDKSPFPVDWAHYLHNRLRLAFVHFNPARLGRVVSSLRDYPSFGEALMLVAAGDAAVRRRELLAKRTRSDDWYCGRFGLAW